MRITIDGQTIRAVNLNDARGRDVIALQAQTGYGLDEIIAFTQDKTKHALLNKMIEFLSEHNRGKFVTWEEVLDRPVAFSEPDPGDQPDTVDGQVAEDPTSASTVSQPGDVDAAVETAPTPRSKRSTAKSPASSTRSTAASSKP